MKTTDLNYANHVDISSLSTDILFQIFGNNENKIKELQSENKMILKETRRRDREDGSK